MTVQKTMTNLIVQSMMLSWGILSINNPLLMALLFIQLLVLTSCLIGSLSAFMGLMVFIVYVGGIIILISYCVILIPATKFPVSYIPFFLIIILYGYTLFSAPNPIAYSYGLLYRRSAVLLLGLLLYFVLLSVVDIINYSRGILK